MGGFGNVDKLRAALRQGIADRNIDPDIVDPWYFPTVPEYRQELEDVGFTVPYIELIDRLTPLPTGIGGWIESVAHPFLEILDASEHDDFVAEIEHRVRPYLLDENGVWHADYVRLRFMATKT